MLSQRVDTLREVDKTLMDLQPYILGWGINNHRILYWNKFGYPNGYFSKIGNTWDILTLWWFDKEKNRILKKALGDKSVTMKVGKTKQDYWLKKAK